ncbi:MAG: hypothetical protein MI923_27650 [Phycisphaerales bacterium]|nr:hypothetical protein [Phycisphaerales bacterium]
MKKGKLLVVVFVACCFGMGNDCEQRVCCLPDGTCVQGDPTQCILQGGFSADSCEECQIGLRCCLPSGNCVEVLSITDCGNMAGSIVDVCDDSCQPRTQNCCFAQTGDCRELDADDCVSQGGTNFIDQSCDQCRNVNAGACCLSPTRCLTTESEAACTLLGGVAFSTEVTCDDGACITGSCCKGDDDCTDLVIRISCNGTFSEEPCEDVVCD